MTVTVSSAGADFESAHGRVFWIIGRYARAAIIGVAVGVLCEWLKAKAKWYSSAVLLQSNLSSSDVPDGCCVPS